MKFDDLKEALARLHAPGSPQFEWGERALKRCVRVYHASSAGPADRLVALRHALRLVAAPLRIADNGLLFEQAREHGLDATKVQDGVIVRALPANVGDTFAGEPPPSHVFDPRAQFRHNYDRVAADPWVGARSGDAFNLLPEQRIAIRAMLSCPPGATLATSLPTGGGKSRIALMPQCISNRGMAAVIIPTVALALDQVAKAVGVLGPDNAATLIGSTSAKERAAIFRRVEEGSLKVLYLGPEMAVGSALGQLSRAVADGRLTTLVIDEAHLMSQWGREFRPEYTLLPDLRNVWLDRSGGTLRTLLLSATWSRSLLEEVRGNFSHGTGWRFIDAGTLRCEHDFVAGLMDNEDDRREILLWLLRHVPRPAIVYVTQKKDAEPIARWIKAAGFARVATFTGETDGSERDSLVRSWNSDDIDIMIATSAFGVGVDKQDVRVVIHACLPEGIDRFYQEAGRAGRDGYAALSALLPVNRRDTIHAIRQASHHSPENARERVAALYRGSRVAYEDDRIVRAFSLDSMRKSLKERESSDFNRHWNKATLGWLHRLGLIRVLLDGDVSDGVWSAEVLDAGALTPEAMVENGALEQAFREERDAHYDAIRPQLDELRSVTEKPHCCIQALFAAVYRLDKRRFLLCGRCPYCGYWDRPLSLAGQPLQNVPWKAGTHSAVWRAWIEVSESEFPRCIEVRGHDGLSHVVCEEFLRETVAAILVRLASALDSEPIFLSTFGELTRGTSVLEPVPTLVLLNRSSARNATMRALFESQSESTPTEQLPVAFVAPESFQFDGHHSPAAQLYRGPVLDLETYASVTTRSVL